MTFNKKQITCFSSFFLYLLALLLIVGTGLYIITVFIDFIINNKGIGVYGGLIYYVASFISAILWGVSYWLIPNKKMAAIYWAVFFVFIIFIGLQPVWWAAPSINS